MDGHPEVLQGARPRDIGEGDGAAALDVDAG